MPGPGALAPILQAALRRFTSPSHYQSLSQLHLQNTHMKIRTSLVSFYKVSSFAFFPFESILTTGLQKMMMMLHHLQALHHRRPPCHLYQALLLHPVGLGLGLMYLEGPQRPDSPFLMLF